LKGLSFSPSDHESEDGDLGAMVNLLNEDGALKAITLGGGNVVGEIPSECSIAAVHKGSDYTHWILNCDGVWKWVEKNGSGVDEDENIFDFPSGFTPLSAVCMGNVVCFVGEDRTVYALWKDGAYVMFSMEDFHYDATIYNYGERDTDEEGQTINGRKTYDLEAYLGDNFIGCFVGDPLRDNTEMDDEGFPEEVSAIRVKKEGSMEIFRALDAKLTEQLETDPDAEHYLRHITLGVLAVRLYDSSLVNVSDIFVLGPSGLVSLVNCDRDDKTVSGKLEGHRHAIRVNMPAVERLRNIVAGVDIYLTRGDVYWDTDKLYSLDVGGRTGAEHFYGSFMWDALKGKDLYEAIDGEVFCLMDTISVEDLIAHKTIHLNRVTGAETAMTLSDFRRGDIGGKYSYVYNNRLHLASVKQKIGTPMVPRLNNVWPAVVAYFDNGAMFNGRADCRGTVRYESMEAVMEVRGTFAGEMGVYYYHVNDLRYPMGPIVCVPNTGARELTMYIKVEHNDGALVGYYKKTMKLHQSTSWGCSYYIDEGAYVSMRLAQVVEYDTPLIGDMTRRDDWKDSTAQEFSAMASKKNDVWKEQGSLIKVSEVDNPLVFPVGNTVQVGAGKILGMATNTEAISEGQYGTAPLYAFTDEGVWPLEVSNTGTYRSLGQPSSRDVITDARSITPIFKGVLFATKRGLMIIRGNQVECLTDNLRGIPWDFSTLPHSVDVLGGIDMEAVQYDRIEQMMKDARMLYDYARERVYVYRESDAYALVLSLRSGLWGVVENGGLTGGVPWYPETYILRATGNGKKAIVDLSDMEHEIDMADVMCCTRPLSLGAREMHKSVMHAVVRGLAHMRGSGEESRLGCAIWGSNDLYHWFAVNSSTNQYLRGRYGQPYKWWRIAIVGRIDPGETIDGVTMDVKVRLNNRLR